MQNIKEIVFVHGLGQTAASWDRLLSYLPEDTKAIAMDLPSLSRGSEMTYRNLYGAFKEACNRREQPIHLCGISLGAVLALNYAIEYPQHVRSMILIAPQYKMPRLLLKLQGLIFRLMPQSVFQDTGFSKSDFTVLTGSMADLDFSNMVPNISCQPYILCGSKDKANMKAAKELELRIAGAKLHVVEESGHEVNVDAPGELAEVIIEYFRLRDRSAQQM